MCFSALPPCPILCSQQKRCSRMGHTLIKKIPPARVQDSRRSRYVTQVHHHGVVKRLLSVPAKSRIPGAHRKHPAVGHKQHGCKQTNVPSTYTKLLTTRKETRGEA